MNIEKMKKVQSILCDIYIGFTVTLFVLYTGTQGYLKIATDKHAVFLVSGAAFAAGVLFVFFSGLIDSKDKRKFLGQFGAKISVPHIFALGYLGFTAISAVASKYSGVLIGNSRKDGVITVLIYVFVLFALALFANPKRWHVYAFGGTVLVNCVLCFLQLADFNPLYLYPSDMASYYDGGIKYTGQYLGTIGNVDLLGAFFCVCIPLFIVYFIRKSEDKFSPAALAVACVALAAARLMWVLACIVGLAAFFVFALPTLFKDAKTLRRTVLAYAASLFALGVSFLFQISGKIVFSPSPLAALLFAGALVLILLYVFLYAKDIKPDIKLLKRILWIVLAIAFVLALVFVYFYPAQSGLLYEVHEIMHGRAQDSFGTSRVFIWRNVAKALPNHFILGTGPDTMLEALGLKFYKYNEAGEVVKSVGIDTAHNEYLNIFSNQGLFALLCYLGALAYSAYLWIKNQNRDGVCIAGAAVLGYCVQAFFGISQFITAPFLWLSWALLLKYAEEEQ